MYFYFLGKYLDLSNVCSINGEELDIMFKNNFVGELFLELVLYEGGIFLFLIFFL